MFDLSGKVAVVTGGLGILGRHFCSGLADGGANVAVVDLHLQSPCELAQELTELYGVNACGFGCDVFELNSVQDMITSVIKE